MGIHGHVIGCTTSRVTCFNSEVFVVCSERVPLMTIIMVEISSTVASVHGPFALMLESWDFSVSVKPLLVTAPGPVFFTQY